MAEIWKEWADSKNWSSYRTTIDGSSTSATVLFSTLLVLVLSTVALYSYSAISVLSLSRRVKSKGMPPLPPGWLGLPVVGETLAFTKNTKDFMTSRHAKYGPIFKSNVLGETVFLKAPDSNKFLFVNESKLVQNSWTTTIRHLLGKDSLFVKTGDVYRRSRRSHINPLFSPSHLEKYVPWIEERVRSNLAEKWQPSGVGDTGHGQEASQEEEFEEFELAIWDSVNRIAFHIIAELVLSLPPDNTHTDLDEMRRLFGAWTAGLLTLPINLPGTGFHKAMKARARILEILTKLVAMRRVELEEGKATPGQDFLSFWLTERDVETGELMSDDELKDTLLLFLNAGHSTSSHTMALALRDVALNPDVYDILKKEHDSIAEAKDPGEGLTKDDLAKMNYTWGVLQETLRMVSPVRGGFREMITDVEYDGYTIPKGWKMGWTTASHMDPKFFKEPTSFDPTRFEGKQEILPYSYVPFGGGVRICPGNDFAKFEMLIYMHHVIRNFKFTLVYPDEPVYHAPLPSQKSGTLMRIQKLRSIERSI